MKTIRLTLISAALLAAFGTARAADTNQLLQGWFQAQTNMHTWSADAVQTRALRNFSQPLVSTGKVWVAMPDRFRWELGQPPQTIAVREPKELVLIYPRLKRAEKYSLAGNQPGPWRDALALLEASFPRSRAQLESRFRVASVAETNGTVTVSLEPKSGFAKRFMKVVDVGFKSTDFTPVFTELKFSDGSSMRNDFSQSVLNEPISDSLFRPELGGDYNISEPLKN